VCSQTRDPFGPIFAPETRTGMSCRTAHGETAQASVRVGAQIAVAVSASLATILTVIVGWGLVRTTRADRRRKGRPDESNDNPVAVDGSKLAPVQA
jgi:hypothetical protein